MNVEILHKIESSIQLMNHKQQIIANRVKIEKNFRFFETTVNGQSEIFFENMPTKEIFNFISYIKSNCGCD